MIINSKPNFAEKNSQKIKRYKMHLKIILRCRQDRSFRVGNISVRALKMKRTYLLKCFESGLVNSTFLYKLISEQIKLVFHSSIMGLLKIILILLWKIIQKLSDV